MDAVDRGVGKLRVAFAREWQWGRLLAGGVVLNVLLDREPFVSTSASAVDAVPRGEVAGYLAEHAVTTLFYFLNRNVGQKRARVLVGHLLSKLTVAATTDRFRRMVW